MLYEDFPKRLPRSSLQDDVPICSAGCATPWNPHPIPFKVSRITTTEDFSIGPGFRNSLTINAPPRSVSPGQHFPSDVALWRFRQSIVLISRTIWQTSSMQIRACLKHAQRFRHPSTITVKIAMHLSLVDLLNVLISRRCYE